ncbi:PQQ-dependent sugar dehydrogenase [Pirellulales bacterium]|nr:PQQ-dependent sugar dehydrogenase [Pirellulales bacterium]
MHHLNLTESRRLWFFTLFLLPTALAAQFAAGADSATSDAATADPLQVEFTPAFGGHVFERPIYLTHAGDGSERLYVMGHLGTIHVLDGAEDDAPELILDIQDKVQFHENMNEEGLLGLAFHPQFKQNRELYAYYTPRYDDEADRRGVIARFRAASDGLAIDPDSEQEILVIDQPYWNHNGGTIIFGPDGMLYVGLGDGGMYGDPHGHAQNTQTLLGSVLRIDVDRKDPGLNYAIPPGNPFAGRPEEGRGEIWAYGVRNIWRMSFHPETGEMWAGDVGQNLWEEIDVIRAGGNYGWNIREGLHHYEPKEGNKIPPGYPPDKTLEDFKDVEFLDPVWEYHHDEGKSVTGGLVYHGPDAPQLQGKYLYADYISGAIYAIDADSSGEGAPVNRRIREKGLPVTSFGEGPGGEAYILETNGEISRIRQPNVN